MYSACEKENQDNPKCELLARSAFFVLVCEKSKSSPKKSPVWFEVKDLLGGYSEAKGVLVATRGALCNNY